MALNLHFRWVVWLCPNDALIRRAGLRRQLLLTSSRRGHVACCTCRFRSATSDRQIQPLPEIPAWIDRLLHTRHRHQFHVNGGILKRNASLGRAVNHIPLRVFNPIITFPGGSNAHTGGISTPWGKVLHPRISTIVRLTTTHPALGVGIVASLPNLPAEAEECLVGWCVRDTLFSSFHSHIPFSPASPVAPALRSREAPLGGADQHTR